MSNQPFDGLFASAPDFLESMGYYQIITISSTAPATRMHDVNLLVAEGGRR